MELRFLKKSKKLLLLGLLMLTIPLVYLIKNNLSYSEPEIVWKADSKNIIGNLYAQDKVLYYGTLDGYLYSIDGLTNNTKWKFKLNNQEIVLKKPIISNGVIYILSDKNSLYSLDVNTGQEEESKSVSKEDFIEKRRYSNSMDRK